MSFTWMQAYLLDLLPHNQATSRMDPRVLQTMLPYFTEDYGNPHSRTHIFGWSAAQAVEKAREQVAQLIGASAKEIIFTSGATECNNIAVKGVAQFYKGKKNHIITTQTEHKCVLDSCRWLSERGFDVTYLPVQKNGLINLDDLENAITDKTSLVSVMGVNNEIGVVQPLKEIGAICRKHGVHFHTDCAQMFGKLPLDVDAMNIDLMSISGHKCYGPKGVGALYIRRKPRVRLEPLMSGGGQERGYRSGTLPTPLVVGLGKAAELCKEEMEGDLKRIKRMADGFIDRIQRELPDVTLNGDREHRWPGNVNLSFSCVEGESLIMAMPNIAVSTGSACTSASLEPSYVMRALGVPDELAHTSIRFGISRFTKEWEMEKAADIIIAQVKRLREISPLWEMKQQGIDLSTIKWSSH
ncbi:Cysteine desulfurase Nfs1 [Blastocystis hominis]|uniref:cysteine desulfurase n=1 Tax=Blastocystis hominis TaxID=12968 RepID=D8M7Z6_BLAHO|nr:Cysteine desulfurase Nfs1 [Blastocystis hominis]CBK24185.2 Cysteine desulfurase Nfs1 [Blastocystis hominis]|eukprot:XP_012898233.1 Cysteine desulfurase Nfs1 [Blastocystis hominis]